MADIHLVVGSSSVEEEPFTCILPVSPVWYYILPRLTSVGVYHPSTDTVMWLNEPTLSSYCYVASDCSRLPDPHVHGACPAGTLLCH